MGPSTRAPYPPQVAVTTTGAGRFVGREHELNVIAAACAAAATGRRQIIVVSGEPGIGKSSLCDEATIRAERVGFTVVWGRCWPDGGAPPLWPWHGVLRQLLGEDAVRLLVDEPGSDDVEPERFGRFAALADRLIDACAEHPTMVVIDDIHAADPGTLLLARFFARSLDRVPFVLVAARRPTPEGGNGNVEPAVARLLAEIERDATTLVLRRFDVAETAAFLAACGCDDLDRTLVLTLVRVSGGLPLHLARVLSVAKECDGVVGVEQAIGAALGDLAPATRRLLGQAAVLGSSPSASEIAAVSRRPVPEVIDAMTDAAMAGVVVIEPPGAITFGHELVRQAALVVLDPAERLDVHAGAAARLRGDQRPEQLTRFAHHALAAAVRSDADAVLAVDACRAAARAVRRGYDDERAAELLGAAADLVERRSDAEQTDRTTRAEVLIEWAEAIRACGRLTEARATFNRAVDAAEAAGDPVLMARAALGLAGIWLNEDRAAVDRRRALALQRRAIAVLPDEQAGLRGRLRLRLLAEAVYVGGSVEPVLEALAAVRRLDDPAALAEALSVTHNALLAPEHVADRLPLAEEQIDVAAAAGEGLLVLLGLMWRTVDLYHLGDPLADRSLAELHERADALACRSILYVAECMQVMRLVRAGRLDEAEAAAAAALELGTEVGDPDAIGYYGGQLLTLRWLQDRDEEMFDLVTEVAGSTTLVLPEFTFRASVALVAARAGRFDEARRALDALAADRLDELPRSSTWLSGMCCIIEAARTLGDAGLAEQAHALLAPFARLPVMPSFAITCLGSVERFLGLAALTFGDQAAAIAHLERALAANRRLGNRPIAAVTRADLAEALAARGEADDADRALALLETAVAEASGIGMVERAATWAGRADAVRRRRAGTDLRRPEIVMRADGHRWILTAGDRRVVVPDLVGLRYLATLLDRPGQDVSALELCGAAGVDAGRHEVLDEAAIAAYRRRARDLDADIAAAEADADLARAERLRDERDVLVEEVSSAVGLGGRPRAFASAGERARTAVRKAIKRAIDTITGLDQDLGVRLGAEVETGTTCRYTPR